MWSTLLPLTLRTLHAISVLILQAEKINLINVLTQKAHIPSILRGALALQLSNGGVIHTSAEHYNIILGGDLFHDEWSERVQNTNNKISKEERKSREIERR
jgi:hypothetical protein